MGHIEAVLSEGAMVSRCKLQKAVTARKAGSSRCETADKNQRSQKAQKGQSDSPGKASTYSVGERAEYWQAFKQQGTIPPVSKAVQCFSRSSMQRCHGSNRDKGCHCHSGT